MPFDRKQPHGPPSSFVGRQRGSARCHEKIPAAAPRSRRALCILARRAALIGGASTGFQLHGRWLRRDASGAIFEMSESTSPFLSRADSVALL